MLTMLILSLTFIAGFCSGYAVRVRRSHKRRERQRLYAPYAAESRATTFGHPRRAF
ncbi:hypothetical protein SAMN05444159_1712 [Bradyrhizobium lablabi]|uniref:Uncharacterized protein n=1 Tax=Bradyrhizobium lablabi TaxID=722472 RepID=A0A1M6MR76_9BRAD|nr:hypothetical protein SAMN05444159_1712 [Bradyrhizobium lablabi]